VFEQAHGVGLCCRRNQALPSDNDGAFVVACCQCGISPMNRQATARDMKGLWNHFMVTISVFDLGTVVPISPRLHVFQVLASEPSCKVAQQPRALSSGRVQRQQAFEPNRALLRGYAKKTMISRSIPL
jgi:hypothetical protein